MVVSFGFSDGDLIIATEIAKTALSSLTAIENESNKGSVTILSFRALQAQRISELQEELYELSLQRVQALALSTPKPAMVDRNKRTQLGDVNNSLDESLIKYADAIRNYETFSQEALDLDSFQRDDRAKSIIRNIFRLPEPQGHAMANQVRAISTDPNLSLNFRELNKDIREAEMRKQAFSERIWMGALGGIAVIGPMLLMSLHRTLTTSLVTSSVATVLFTLVLALGARNLKGQEVLGAVAAYAAVLVVFIGTSIPPVS